MLFNSALAFASLLSLTVGASPPKCGEGLDACPEDYPCCSLDGVCGNGYVCMGGCDVRYSNQPGACMPMPQCRSQDTKFTSTDQVTPYEDYMGDAEQSNWSYLGNITVVDGTLRAQLFSHTTGTTISSSHYIWYGKTTVRMKSSFGAGVISDVILLSGVKDEIDYEGVGNNLNQAQTNWYWHGALDYTKMKGSNPLEDTSKNFHDYTIDWRPDQIDWIIDGEVQRTLKRDDTYNATSKSYSFPQTPSRLQFGLWPAGDSDAEGTADWAGGKINWETDDITGEPGYKFVEIESATIECYDPPANAGSGSKSYKYKSKEGMAEDVELSDDDTVMGSTDGTGLNPNGSKNQKNGTRSADVTASGLETTAKRSNAAVTGLETTSTKPHQGVSGLETTSTKSHAQVTGGVDEKSSKKHDKESATADASQESGKEDGSASANSEQSSKKDDQPSSTNAQPPSQTMAISSLLLTALAGIFAIVA